MSTTTGYDDLTRDELYQLAQERDINGRSEMDRAALVAALELEDTGPDALELLRRQHDEIRARFDAIEQLSRRPSRKKELLVAGLVTDLVKHAEIEELVFYPAVKAELGAAGDEVDEGLEEHHAAELVLRELDGAPSNGERYDAKVSVLAEQVRHHMDEEETELFPQVEEVFDEIRRRELGAAMVSVWRTAPTGPHPLLPDTPPFNLLLTPLTTAWDLLVGAARVVRPRRRRRRRAATWD